MPLIHTTEEVAEWVKRKDGVSGHPYKSEWDNRIAVNGNAYKNSSSTRSSELWPGNKVNVPWDSVKVMNNDPSMNDPTAGRNYFPSRTTGVNLEAAAFMGLVLGDTSYTNLVRSALLTEIGYAGTDWTNTSKWNTTLNGQPNTQLSANAFQIVNYLKRLAYAYSFIEDVDNLLTAQNKTDIKAWFLNAGNFWMTLVDNEVENKSWPNRANDDYTPPPVNNPGGSSGPVYFGGPNVCTFHKGWVNIPCQHASFSGIAGVLANNDPLKNRARRFYEEFITYSVHQNGTQIDLHRWNGTSPTDPALGYGYGGSALGPMVRLADVFGRNGDVSLLDYTANGGLFGWEGSGKNLGLASLRYCQMALADLKIDTVNGVRVYASLSSTTSDGLVIGPKASRGTDMFMAPANVYFKNALVKKCYTRSMPPVLNNGSYDNYLGEWGNEVSVLFTSGQMEGVTNPYGSPSVIVTNVQVEEQYLAGFVVSFQTDLPCVSTVDYGLTASYGSSTPASLSQTSHVHFVSGLSSYKIYHAVINAGGTLSSDIEIKTGLKAPTGAISTHMSG